MTLRFVRARWARPWPTGLPRPHWRRAPADEVGSRYRLDQPSEAPACPDDCVQRIQRVQPADGSDVLWGLLTTRLLPGQATAHVHVAFCPPFARVPRVEYRQVSGPAARIKLGQLLPHGARFDVKRTTDGTSQIVLEVRAVHDPHGD